MPSRLIRRFVSSLSLLALVALAADRPSLLAQDQYKDLPPAGIEVPQQEIDTLSRLAAKTRRELERLAENHADADRWQPDVEVMIRAVELAIDQGLFYRDSDIQKAKATLQTAVRRLEAAEQGARGLGLLKIGSRGEYEGRTLVGGFKSRIDGSVQPYGLVLPEDFFEAGGVEPEQPLRVDVWLHGRGDTKTEVPFIDERLSRLGIYSPAGTVVLHPFGRHCNAFKFAGETDVYESLEHLADWLPVDPARVSIRGFSMGGAGCWHLAAHDPGRWFAANPGAGFVDTIRYQGWDNKGIPYDPGHWGRRLMHWYDVEPWVENLKNTRVIAYSGEEDKQRQAAEFMVAAAERAGVEIEHVIGAGMGHKIDDASAVKIDRRLAQWAEQAGGGYRQQVHLVTYTLRYPRIDWVVVEGMQRHWERASVEAELVDGAVVRIATDNVDRLRLDFSKHGWPLADGPVRMQVDDQRLAGPQATQGQPLVVELIQQDGSWYELDSEGSEAQLRKRPGLQGPIDDALTEPFLFVLPSRPCRHGVVERFVQREAEHARRTWRRVMRGEDRVVLDSELTAEMIDAYNLVCFGDFTGNRFLASIADGLPIRWGDERLEVGQQSYAADSHALLMVYPNPRNPDRYVVVNSGVTFRQFSNVTNSRQIAMLPDWAVIDVAQPADGIYPGRVVAADFFDERWQLAAGAESSQ